MCLLQSSLNGVQTKKKTKTKVSGFSKWLYRGTVPVGGLEGGLDVLTSMGSNVGSSSRMSWLSFSREESSSASSGHWLTASCAGSRWTVWPTLRTWLGIMWDMPLAVGIMLGELAVLLPKNETQWEGDQSSLEWQSPFCALQNRHNNRWFSQMLIWYLHSIWIPITVQYLPCFVPNRCCWRLLPLADMSRVDTQPDTSWVSKSLGFEPGTFSWALTAKPVRMDAYVHIYYLHSILLPHSHSQTRDLKVLTSCNL